MEATTHPGRDIHGRWLRDDRNLATAVGILAAGLAKLAAAVELPAMDARVRIEVAQDVRAAANEVQRWLNYTDTGAKPSAEASAAPVEHDEP